MRDLGRIQSENAGRCEHGVEDLGGGYSVKYFQVLA